MQDLVNKGLIARDTRGRFTMKNGDPIVKNNYDESLVQAVNRAVEAKSNLITVEDCALTDEEEEEWSAYPVQWDGRAVTYGYWSEEASGTDVGGGTYVYPVERPKRKITATRKAQQEGGWNPAGRAKDGRNSTFRTPKAAGSVPANDQGHTAAPANQKSTASKENEPPVLRIFNPYDNDAIMEDATTRPAKPSTPASMPSPVKSRTPIKDVRIETTVKEDKDRRQPRRSELQSMVNS